MGMEQAKRRAERTSGVPNLTYDLVAVLHNKLGAFSAYEVYRQDAEVAGDRDAAAFFEACQDADRDHIGRLRVLLGRHFHGGSAGGSG